MPGMVIQGNFIGGRPRTEALGARPPAGAARVLQQRGGTEAFAVNPAQLGIGASRGQPLPEAVRAQMENAMGADFSGVRVHVGPQAERIGAVAFTMGSDIFFAPGRYQPNTLQGQQLLGHELAHVVQQRQGRVRNPTGASLAVVQDPALEAEADRLGHLAARPQMVQAQRIQAKRIQAKPAEPHPVRISAPQPSGPGQYRLTASIGGRPIGAVTLHANPGKPAAELTDLGVDAPYRQRGVGQLLLKSAAQAGQRFGKSTVSLAAQDNGGGKLVRWYEGMGFARTGVNQLGYPTLKAPAARVAGAAQRSIRKLGSA